MHPSVAPHRVRREASQGIELRDSEIDVLNRAEVLNLDARNSHSESSSGLASPRLLIPKLRRIVVNGRFRRDYRQNHRGEWTKSYVDSTCRQQRLDDQPPCKSSLRASFRPVRAPAAPSKARQRRKCVEPRL